MSRLLLIRHGQASANSDDYDHLSDLGARQGQALGEAWIEQGFEPSAVYAGPLRRQRQTERAVAEVFARRGRPWPEVQELPALSEHQAMEVVREAAPQVAQHDAEIAAWHDELERHPERRIELYFRIFRKLTRRWVRGELAEAPPHLESWTEFRRRVATVLTDLGANHQPDEKVVAFTSAGAVAAAAGHVLELHDEKVLELSWMVPNISSTELHFAPYGLVLRNLNLLPHTLEEPLRTFV
ncbi:MAG: histidine phosphatase family protein [Acidobacteriota bacterium]